MASADELRVLAECGSTALKAVAIEIDAGLSGTAADFPAAMVRIARDALVAAAAIDRGLEAPLKDDPVLDLLDGQAIVAGEIACFPLQLDQITPDGILVHPVLASGAVVGTPGVPAGAKAGMLQIQTDAEWGESILEATVSQPDNVQLGRSAAICQVAAAAERM